MQLVAYGAQDIYLSGNPQMTFFKVVYRRHTNFSMEAVKQTFDGTLSAGESTLSYTISRNGDLVYRMWLDVKMASQGVEEVPDPDTQYSNWTNNTGHAFVKECEVEIGEQRIDRHYSQWLDVWNELADHEESEWMGLNKNSAKKSYLRSSEGSGANEALQLYIPLQFWFCRNPGLALPLIALQYHEVKVKLTTRSMNGLVNISSGLGTNPSSPTCNLYCDYIYLDTDERRRFAQVSHEYLIEQVQEQSLSGGDGAKSHDLNFNHPVKELIWVDNGTTYKNGVTPTAGEGNLTAVGGYNTTYQLKLNGHDRMAARPWTYFTKTQVWEHHSGYGGISAATGTGGDTVGGSNGIAVYSFALKPEEHQPSGTCNFSRIDNAQLVCGVLNTADTCFAVNYNVLRIMSGMGGLAYSN